jgi:cytochrome b subunit of formate dehydrogenase
MNSLWFMRGVCAGVLVMLLAGSVRSAEVTQAEIDNRRCYNCHAQSQLADMPAKDRKVMVSATTQPVNEPEGPRPGLYIKGDTLDASVHAKLACVDCHTEAKTLPHPQKMGKASCSTSCHANANSDYLQGAHAEAIAKGVPNAPTCSSCHGTHDILPKKDRNSKTFPLNIVKVCGDCHKTHTSTDGLDGAEHIQHYLDSVHGKAVAAGMSVAATCADCHTNHKVLPSKNTKSSVYRENIAQTCGRCHTGVSEIYATSIHGQELAKGNSKAPVCSDCHTAHAITRTDTPSFQLDIVKECGTCHDKPFPGSTSKLTLYDTYRMSYHGQVTSLGMTRAARCSDCHGAHDIRKNDDPKSRLSAENKLSTCQQCHKGAPEKFAMFSAHADFHDAQRYPLLHGVFLYFVIMMSFAFGFFGLHSVMWFFRSMIDRIRNGPLPSHHHSPKRIKRFSRVDRINHAFVIISFFGLTLTGLPLLYADKEWGKGLARLLGGPNFAGYLHRFFAIMLILNFVVHGVGIVNRIRKHGLLNLVFGPTTMLPRWKDVTDCLGMWKWFFQGGHKPAFDRWTYWEKFDYVAEVGGSMIIGFTGLLLWFPQFFANYLPGWMFNVATIVHGYEALLAIGFIFTIHFFNAHLRMEKFPVDDVMFSGSLPEEEFKEERPTEYARLLAKGELDALRVGPPKPWYRTFAVTAGIVAMAIGTTLVVLIILAGLKWI